MKRIYHQIITDHFAHYQQMLFLAGPRQVGKTTISLAAQTLTDRFYYLNWDNQDHSQIILAGPSAVADHIELYKASIGAVFVVFDELHKYQHWKNFLKGFFDTYKNKVRIIVTGSAKLDVYKNGGDSLMGRYFPYRIHPFSVAETLIQTPSQTEIRSPAPITTETFQTLFNHGGFPEPFLNQNNRFTNRWKQLRNTQLFREDLRDLSRIQEVGQLEVLARLIKHQTGQLMNYSNLANKVKVSVDTIRRWIETLNAFYYSFIIKPWSKNITRSLIKEPKIYLWDWSEIEDPGSRAENFIASHLLKAIHFWTDQGLGYYDLYFIRDKEKRGVDFLVTKDNTPWFLVEVKSSDNDRINPNLARFQQQLGAPHAFQVVLDIPYLPIDCFSYKEPVIVPANTFLSQLV